jgi:Ferrous iron transport protein B
MSCHSPSPDPSAERGVLRPKGPVSPNDPAFGGEWGGGETGVALAPAVVLVGNPNVGKSTLFNRLTGAHARVVNAPGTTVEIRGAGRR